MECRLADIRKSRGLSRNALARAVGMSPQGVQKIERGLSKSIPLATLGRLCQALGCAVGDILVYIPDQPAEVESQTT